MASSSADEPVSKRAATTRTCGVCKLELPGDRALYDHVKTAHVETWVSGQVCGWCECLYANASDKHGFRVHMRTHTGERQFVCRRGCGKSFIQNVHLEAHERSHTGHRPYKCRHDNCNKTYGQMGGRDAHERKHTGARPYACAVCNTRYAHSNRRDKCQLYHTLPKCERCRKRPQTRGTLCGYCDNSKHTRT
jgi:hypothetical protein